MQEILSSSCPVHTPAQAGYSQPLSTCHGVTTRPIYGGKNSNSMNIELISVTPELAAQWLATNTDKNRRLSKTTVQRYASDMIRNRWQPTGEAIKFDSDGRLIDGQHRLNAVVASKKNVQMLVVRDLSTEVIQVLDTGKPRSAADALTISGHTGSAPELAALARKIIAHEGGAGAILRVKKIRIGNSPITNKDIIDYCHSHDLSDHIRFSHRMKYQAITAALNIGEYAFFHWLFGRINPQDAESFLGKVATLEDVPANSPVRALLQKLTRSAIPIDGKMKMHAIVTAWNAYRTKQPLTVIHVGRLLHDEPIPKAI